MLFHQLLPSISMFETLRLLVLQNKRELVVWKQNIYPENLVAVREAIEQRIMSLCPSAFRLPDHSIWWMLHKDLGFDMYKIQFTLALKEQDHGNRVQFCQILLQLMNDYQNLVNNSLMRDEAQFYFTGHVNKQRSILPHFAAIDEWLPKSC